MYRRLRNPQIASVIVCSKWDQMVYNTVLTAEKRGSQIAGAQIAGAYCTLFLYLSDPMGQEVTLNAYLSPLRDMQQLLLMTFWPVELLT